ncbi:MAG: outer membrane beta-barrel protein, partial [Ginsengibacter sp.]
MKPLLALFFGFIPGIKLIAQHTPAGNITVAIKNESQQPLEDATVELRNGKDSSLAKVGISDSKGKVAFEHVEFGTYLLKATMVNHSSIYTAPFTSATGAPAIITVTLPRQSAEMKEVVVTAKKPFIQKLTDRIVVNVDNSIISAGSSAMDVLQRSPGVNVDQNDVLSLRGKQGIIIMIDGKPTPMSGTDLANYLKGLPSSVVDRIDIITNPSAKYDAAGNSGIIDIHMKKDKRLGTNGTVNASYGQGVYSKVNAGATLNYRNKNVNVFGNYSYGYRKGLNHLILDRNFFTNGTFDGEDKKDNYTTFPLNFHLARMGADFFIDKKTIIGVVVNSNFIDLRNLNTNNSTVIDNQKRPSYTFQTHQNGTSGNDNTLGNINFKHTFDSTGTELTADIDYGVFHSDALSNNVTQYYKLDGGILQPSYILLGNQHGKLTLKTAKADYVNPLKNGAKFEAGFKTSDVASDNDAKFFDASSGIPQNDTTKTNHFLYEEYNNAGYINFSKEYKKFNFQLGLRGEATSLKTHQLKGGILFDSAYFQLFPSAFFNYNITKDQTLGVSVSRRIDRPNYSSLNPFLFLIDVSTYNTGNTGLLP